MRACTVHSFRPRTTGSADGASSRAQVLAKLELNRRFAPWSSINIASVWKAPWLNGWQTEHVVERLDNPRLLGLVLAGGRSSRMGSDKGSLIYGSAGLPQVAVAVGLLERVCTRTFVSISAPQQHDEPYTSFELLIDTYPNRGPAGGLMSAFGFEPAAAWLVLAVDMPRVSLNVLQNLIRQRDSSAIATVHCHADGVIEPLCAIWEPSASALIREELEHGRGSLRAVAQSGQAAIARLPEPDRLQNINTPEERSDLLRQFGAGSEPEAQARDKGPK